jgi:hypothetical protein
MPSKTKELAQFADFFLPVAWLACSSVLKMAAVCSFETSVNYQTTQRCIPEYTGVHTAVNLKIPICVHNVLFQRPVALYRSDCGDFVPSMWNDIAHRRHKSS